MSDELRAAQAELVASLVDGRVPSGFDRRGIDATAAVLRHKRRKTAKHQAARVGIRAIFTRTIARRHEWLRAIV